MTGFRVTLSSHVTVLAHKMIFNRKNLLIKRPTYCCTVKVLIWLYLLSLFVLYRVLMADNKFILRLSQRRQSRKIGYSKKTVSSKVSRKSVCFA